ncbi:alpha/beta fold hydrolase [Dactylosporangium sp. AC04546]|uniref:alpha/beta fold hydrolase n=1 Tax=Dactylosporangium sp. AC04546 TaxID=2862460 RepID=UPI001EDD4C79|nr:alpha/beta fold hydrolase [Dactylosporangium sp. AC04546]WVK85079.1 alpha/beta fold hydrolase [Dactylosporangium sp. AC04546]
MKTETLAVPGATLHYEVRGSGPVLLLICGGIYDAEGFAGLAEELAGERTVVAYDRRGNSRSPLDGPPAPQRVEEHADDAYRLLAAVGVTGDEPADVFGNSSGATIALELAARHPELLRTVVAHEPPVFELLPDFERFRTLMAAVSQADRESGWGAAMGVFGAGLGMGEEPVPGPPPSPEFAARMQQNMPFFVTYEVPPVSAYRLDLDALRVAATRIVPAAGAASTGEPPNRVALELATRLDTTAVLFPGGHGGFGNAGPFAAKLREVID